MNSTEIQFCPRCATPVTWGFRFGRERLVCPSCDWIYFEDPKVAVAVVVVRQGKVLLVRRANDPQRGKWTLPAGFIDAGEDPALAGERECLEETGLQVKVTRLLSVHSGQEHARGAHILIAYEGEIVSGELTAGDDADEAVFFALDDLPPLAFSSTIDILKGVTAKTHHR
jgi:ADP-ribose pyrophosphatase YjhB (NUDIX family)